MCLCRPFVIKIATENDIYKDKGIRFMLWTVLRIEHPICFREYDENSNKNKK